VPPTNVRAKAKDIQNRVNECRGYFNSPRDHRLDVSNSHCKRQIESILEWSLLASSRLPFESRFPAKSDKQPSYVGGE
jgi:hypothetical protein